jgi:uncharacterized membrane protein
MNKSRISIILSNVASLIIAGGLLLTNFDNRRIYFFAPAFLYLLVTLIVTIVHYVKYPTQQAANSDKFQSQNE